MCCAVRRRNLGFHARAHSGVVLGAAIGSAALIGALVVGDSVKETLRARALQRVANAFFALAPTERTFSRDLAKHFDPFGRITSAPGNQFMILKPMVPSTNPMNGWLQPWSAKLLKLPATA